MKFKIFLVLTLAFSAISFGVNAQTSLLSDLEAERAKYCTPMTKAEIGQLLNTVAWQNRDTGWVLLGKTIGNNCPAPNGILISCDFLVHQPTLNGYDVLFSEDTKAKPQWQPQGSVARSIADGSRTIVFPVQPSGPEEIQRDCNGPQPPGSGPDPGGPGPLPQPLPGIFIPSIIGAVPNNAKPGQKIEIIGTYLGSRIILESADGRQKVELNASLNQQKTRASIDLPSDIKPGKYNVSVVSGNLSDSKPGILTITEAPPGLFPGFGPIQDIGDLIETIFKWGLWLVGLAVFVNFLWAGILWFTAAGRSGPIGQAKEKMWNALIGAIILLASYLILKTINPDLIQQTFTLPGL